MLTVGGAVWWLWVGSALGLGALLSWKSRWVWMGQFLLVLVFAELMLSAIWVLGWRPEPAPPEPSQMRGPTNLQLPLAGVMSASPSLLMPPSRPPGPTDGPPRVLFVGDSFTFGEGVTDDERFAERAVAASGTPTAQVLVGASPGWGLPELAAGYGMVFSHAEPDLVVWVFLPNDLGGGYPATGPEGWHDLVVDRRRDLSDVSRLATVMRVVLRDRIQTRRTVSSYKAALNDPAQLGQLAEVLRWVRADVASRGGRTLFVVFPFLYGLDAYAFRAEHRRVVGMAEAAGWETLDLLDAFEGRDARGLWVHPTDLHPNAAGHQIAAEAIAAAIGEVPKAEGRRDCAALNAAPDAPAAARAELVALCEAPQEVERWMDVARTLCVRAGQAEGNTPLGFLLAQIEVMITDPADPRLAFLERCWSRDRAREGQGPGVP